MNLKEIKHIVELMKVSDLTEFEIEEEGLTLRIKRDHETNAPVVMQAPVAAAAVPAPAAAPLAQPSAPQEEVADGLVIKSPMVGTFYSSSSPDSSPYVEVGAKVKADTVVCIVEAMKVMNEIHAEVAGTIVEILVENNQSVEYGQPLFKVKPA